MFKKYRALAVAIVAVAYAVAAVAFPYALLPSEESVIAVIDAILGALPGVEEVPRGD